MSDQVALKEITEMVSARRFTDALGQAQVSLKEFPQSREIAIKLAELLFTCKQYDQSLSLYSQLHKAQQDQNLQTELVVLLGIADNQIRKNQFKPATELLEKLHTVASKEPAVLTSLASCYLNTKNAKKAEKLLNQALKLKKDHPEAMYEKAKVLIAQKKDDEAVKLLEKNIRRKDLHGDSIDLWISTLDRLNRDRYAQNALKELNEIHPDVLEFAYGYAVLANRAGELPIARKAFKKALELSPQNPRILYEYGVLERVAGDLEYSQELIGKSLEIRPDSPAALRTFGSDLKFEYGDENFKRLNYVAARFSEFQSVDQIHLHYAMAKAMESVGELDTAFRHYAVGGNKKRQLDRYDEKEGVKLGQIVPKIITPDNLAATNEKGSESELPVFILGMPRSGTSLMEQILSAHPDVFGAGELKFLSGVLENIPVSQARIRMGDKEPLFDYDNNVGWAPRGEKYVEKLQELADGDYKRIVDKMPGNFNFVGLIHAILPNAKIIHSRRHPIETCLSCYRIFFAEGHQWTYNLTELGRYYRRYWDLMKHWREAFPGVMHEVRYEENVADVEGQARKLIDYLDLEWNDNCLEFYNVDRPVKTASLSQVRKPIYKTSTNRWRKYEQYLGPLLEEIGDIVEEYEADIQHLIEK
ncbi:MAG: tetratricopeptide repeat-containing sulfotransferase family protein [Neptuniibacter sp.]